MKIEIISFTDTGFELGKRLKKVLCGLGYICGVACAHNNEKLNVRDWTSRTFATADALVFIGAAGIAVRSVAPHVKTKISDPAVIVIDEKANFVIPLLSGHIGGANELARAIARETASIPVITTATDVNNVFAIDEWAARHGLVIDNPERIKWISARLLAGETIKLRSDFAIEGKLPKGIELSENNEYDVVITIKSKGKQKALRLIPRVLAVGVGCKKETSEQTITDAYLRVLAKGSINPKAVREICSIDIKAREQGILDFSETQKLPYRTFGVKALSETKGNFTASAFVQKVTGVDNVCERSAVAATGGRLLIKKNAGNGVTMAVSIPDITMKFEEKL
ncbi:MAG: cobalamin biosynthesis protein [Oscillospiraceae bacterium]